MNEIYEKAKNTVLDYKAMNPQAAIFALNMQGKSNWEISEILQMKMSTINYHKRVLREEGMPIKTNRKTKAEPKSPVRPAGVRLTVAEWWKIKNIDPERSMSDNLRKILFDAKILDTLEIE